MSDENQGLEWEPIVPPDRDTRPQQWLGRGSVRLRGGMTIPEAAEPPVSDPDESWVDLIGDTPIVFGLRAQGHVPTIERMLAEGASWDEIGKEIGWCPDTARRFYEEIEPAAESPVSRARQRSDLHE